MPAASRSRQKRPAQTRAKGAARKRAAPALTDALAAAAWSEADTALAEALAEYDALSGARSEKARGEASALLGQALGRAARRRGLTRFGGLGTTEAFDPARHELTAAIKRAPKKVRVKLQGVARGNEIIVKARVGAVRAKSK
jgi:hypothetical protein